MIIAAGTLLAAASGSANAQIYKCKRADGSTEYAQQPCGADAQEVRVRTAPAASNEGAGSSNQQAIQQSTALSSAAIAERNCVIRAEGDILGPTNRRIAGYQSQIDGLNQQLATANNNLAGATWSAGIRGQIAGLQQSVASERTSADGQLTTARQGCASTRRDREAEIKRVAEGR